MYDGKAPRGVQLEAAERKRSKKAIMPAIAASRIIKAPQPDPASFAEFADALDPAVWESIRAYTRAIVLSTARDTVQELAELAVRAVAYNIVRELLANMPAKTAGGAHVHHTHATASG